jgi:hypothetical protein
LKESILRIFIIVFFLAATLGFAEDSPLTRLASKHINGLTVPPR